MMRRWVMLSWLVVPVLVLAYHYGPGQEGLARERAASAVAEATGAMAAGAWVKVVEACDVALGLLPAGEVVERDRVRLLRGRARVQMGEIPEAIGDLDTLLEEMTRRGEVGGRVREVRAEVALARYYAGWLMRLEGADKEEWLGETERARQHFRLLAEETAGEVPQESLGYQRNLESVVRLERMDLSELEAMPLPKACQQCSNCSQKTRKQKESRKSEAKVPEKQDARGSGLPQRPPAGGS